MTKSRHNTTIIILTAAVLTVFATILLHQSGIFSKVPEVEAVPDNCYNDTLHVITDQDYSPYSFYDAEGNKSGYDVELITLIANSLHMNLDLRFMDWNEGIAAMTAGEADILMTCDYSDSFAGVDHLKKSEPTSVDVFTVYSKHNVSSISALYGKRIAIMENGNVMPLMETLGILKNCIRYKDNRTAMKALIDGEADYAVMRQAVGTTLMEELGTKGIKAYLSAGQSYMCFGIGNVDPVFADRINRAIEELKTSGEYDRLSDKWLTTFVRPYTFLEVLENNFWLVFIFLAVIALILIFYFWSKQHEIARRKEQQRLLEEALTMKKEESQRNDLLYDIIDSGKWSYEIDRNDRITGANYSAKTESLVNRKYTSGDPLSWLAFVHPDDLDRVSRNFWAAIHDHSGKTAYDSTFRLMTSDGSYSWTKSAGKRINRDDGTAELFGMSIDVNEQIEEKERQRKKMEEALFMAQSANRAKTTFLNNMSHDIRTPMNAIIGYTSMAQKYIDDKDRTMDCLSKIEHAGSNLLELVNQVLDMSRIESGKIVLAEEPADVVERAYDMTEIMGQAAAAKNIQISTAINNVRNRKVYTDAGRVSQLIMNILGNAVKYTPQGGHIIYTVAQNACDKPGFGSYTFTVEDNGIGMSKEYLERIFEPFSRENTSTVSKIQGTGLGMSIVKKLVEMMGGDIDIKSEQGKGTRIAVTLTMRLQENDSEAQESEKRKARAELLKGKRVLLVEDNEMNREIATVILEDLGIAVETAEDGDIAVDMMKDLAARGEWHHIDFVLMDIQMPAMNGYEASAAIRAIPAPEGLHMPIIAMTANAFTEDRQAAIDAGMDDHVAKPIDVQMLLNVLTKYV